MTGFSAQWLALRESADHRARNTALEAQVSDWAASKFAKGLMRIVDLGCGSGSNLRALAPKLVSRQHWTLVDYDSALLEVARQSLIAWADHAAQTPAGLLLQIEDKEITVIFSQQDLAADIEKVMSATTDLFSAAAFFDLVSEDWIRRFCLTLNAPLYTVLSYNGSEQWMPAGQSDSKFLEAFHAHQRTDKGFGRAAGPEAIREMVGILQSRGFACHLGPSPWKLSSTDAQQLMRALAEGSAAAVSETGLLSEQDLTDWRSARKLARSCEVGHQDLFALPGTALDS